MSDTGVYLYGFAKPDPVGDFTHSGFEEIGPVRPLMIEGLAAIVSIVPLGVIESGLACEPVNPAWIVPRALHHESVIAAVKARAAVLPVRFGCVFASQQSLAAVAGRHRETIERFLLEIMDQEEWSLKAYLDVDQSIEALLQVDPTLSERFRNLPAAPGARYFLEKRLREDARGLALRTCKAATGRLHQAILEAGVVIHSLPIRGGETKERALVLKIALLIPRDRVDDVFAIAEKAASTAGLVPLVIERSGPWPPYHFCPILAESSS